jgi:hypothetical protein
VGGTGYQPVSVGNLPTETPAEIMITGSAAKWPICSAAS